MVVVAHIHTQFPEKFGIPRQSGLVPSALGNVVMEPEYRNPDAFKGIEEFSHLWLLWEFSKAKQDGFHATVAPPRLGGKERRGVFATRSPFRPNSIGLSCVKLEKISYDTPDGPILTVSGVDLLDGTPIYDIKPYLPFTDSHPEAAGGFADDVRGYRLSVDCPNRLLDSIPTQHRQAVMDILAQDPRPSYQQDAERVYGMEYAGMEIRFTVNKDLLTVLEIIRKMPDKER